jgi:putative transcriptional regulator
MKSAKGKAGTSSGPRKAVGRTRSRPSAGTRILAAIEEATEILRAEGLESKRLTIRTYDVPSTPRICRPEDVKRVRVLLGASQAVLAGFLGVNVNTVRSWEQGKRLPQPIACRFLSEIESDPSYWRRRIGRGTAEGGPEDWPGS